MPDFYPNKSDIELIRSANIRKRPGMYLGQVNHRGVAEMIKGIISSAFNSLKPNVFRIDFIEANSGFVEIRNIQNHFIDNWSGFQRIHGNMYLLDLFAFNALSTKFEIRIYDEANKLQCKQYFEKGELLNGDTFDSKNCSHIEIDFQLDPIIWGNDFNWDAMFLVSELCQFAYLYKQTAIDIRYQMNNEECRAYYHFERGLLDRIRHEALKGLVASSLEVYIDEEIDGFHLELAFAFRGSFVDPGFLRSYVSDYYTHENGSHVEGLIQGIRDALRKYITQQENSEEYDLSTENIRRPLIAILNIKMEDARFSGSVKNHLCNPEIVEPIANRVSQILLQKMMGDPKASESLLRQLVLHD